jgi:hypothetical protein
LYLIEYCFDSAEDSTLEQLEDRGSNAGGDLRWTGPSGSAGLEGKLLLRYCIKQIFDTVSDFHSFLQKNRIQLAHVCYEIKLFTAILSK